MKLKILMVTFMLLCQAAFTAEEQSFKLIYKDYSMLDTATEPLSFGVSWQRSREPGDTFGLFGSIAVLTYQDLVRLEAGCNFIYDKYDHRIEPEMLTGISIVLTEHLTFGVWAEPFYNLYGRYHDDPWGFMLGYTFGIGE